jgi:putative membrane protein
MKRSGFFYFATLLSLMFVFSCGNQTENRDSGYDDQTEASKASNRDAEELQEFIDESISDGMMEVEMADIAINRSENQEIEQIAASIRLDHRSAGNELKSIAASKGWVVPVTMMDKHQRKVEKLQNSNAENFDEEYLDVLVSTHEDAISRIEKCANKAYDPQVTSWANRTLPILRQHLEQCKELSSKVVDGTPSIL